MKEDFETEIADEWGRNGMTDEQIEELRRLKQEGLLKAHDVVREAWRLYRAERFDEMGENHRNVVTVSEAWRLHRAGRFDEMGQNHRNVVAVSEAWRLYRAGRFDEMGEFHRNVVQHCKKKWQKKFDLLDAFQEEKGHCNVPQSYGALCEWVNKQRRRCKQDSEHGIRLAGIGFCWDPYEAKWQERFAQLVAFKEEKGHCKAQKGDGALGEWVRNQRRRCKQNSKRGIQLTGIGFCWST